MAGSRRAEAGVRTEAGAQVAGGAGPCTVLVAAGATRNLKNSGHEVAPLWMLGGSFPERGNPSQIHEEHALDCHSKYVPLFKFRKHFSVKVAWAKIDETITPSKIRKIGEVTAAEKWDFFLKHVYLEL